MIIENKDKISDIIYSFSGLSDTGMLQVPFGSLICIEKFNALEPKYLVYLSNSTNTDLVQEWYNINTNYGEFCPENIKPSKITDFVASNNLTNKIQFTFTPSTGAEPILYDLFQNNILLKEDITSGYEYTISGSQTYFIQASNIFGDTISNTDIGEGAPPPIEIPPSAPTLDIVDTGNFYVINFTTVEGTLPITYNLFRNNILFLSAISPGRVINETPGTFVLIAINEFGSAQSNTIIKV